MTKLDYEPPQYRPTRRERWRAVPWPARLGLVLSLGGVAYFLLLWMTGEIG